MRVFVTGATGWIGSAVVRELISSGNQVVGLARSDEAAASLAALGAEVQHGHLADLESLREGASGANGVIHLAFHFDFTDIEGSMAVNQRAIETLGRALEGEDCALVGAFATMGLTPGRIAIEDDEADPNSVGGPRVLLEEMMLGVASRGIRPSVVRLAPSVHGPGDKGLIAQLVNIARAKGVSAYVGEGSNRWTAVQRFDAAHLFCLALQKASAGARLHAVADEGVPFCNIASVIGRHLNVPVVSISRDEAMSHFGWLGPFVANDNPVSSKLTQERLGWRPTHESLLSDLETGHYFEV